MKVISIFVFILTLSRVAELFAEPASPPPNLIVIMPDDLGYADTGFNGSTELPTPNIDRIARDGVVFTDAYVTYTVCGPSRAGFITGRHGQRHGFERNPAWRPHDPEVGLSLDERTLADALGEIGYTSGIIGKWHLGSHDNFHPLNRGFDEFYGHLGGGLRYFPEDLYIRDWREARNEPESYLTWVVRNWEPVRTEQYLTDEFTREALEFIQRHHENPFFLFLAYNAPHAPMQAPQEEIDKFSHIDDETRRIYAAMVTVMDRGIGELLDLLDELNISDNTAIFFFSDNGGPWNNGSNNRPLRGAKGTAFEGGFRVPYAVRWPGVFPAGLTYTEPILSLDVFATMASYTGIPHDPERPLDGVDLIPYVNGYIEGPPHERIYLRMFDRGAFAMRDGDYKVVRPRASENTLLFNLRNDISESRNLAPDAAGRVSEMVETFNEWSAEMLEPAFQGLDMDEWRNPRVRPRSAFEL